MSPIDPKYQVAKDARSKITKSILDSPAGKKVVVAGAGTGKTFLFKEILNGKKNTLTLSFINALVEDLDIELRGISKVLTLHGFARLIMDRYFKGKARISPLVGDVINQDFGILKGKQINFDALFNVLENGGSDFDFYKELRGYYGYYSYSAIIYLAVTYFRSNPDKIPEYETVLVDEFQDFNPLEVELINQLATKSPIVIAGDDDQAIYDFKAASPTPLRDHHNSGDYAAFNLPYCSRCPQVVVDATNDVIEKAKASGFLKSRIEKPYTYFDDEEKDKVCAKFPAIIHTQCFSTQIAWQIEAKINDLVTELRSTFSVLIISPMKKQLEAIGLGLLRKGFRNIIFPERDEFECNLLAGLRMLLEDAQCNLGWRLVTKELMSDKDFKVLLGKTSKTLTNRYQSEVPAGIKSEVRRLLSALRKIEKKQSPDSGDLEFIFEKLGVDPSAFTQSKLREALIKKKQSALSKGIRGIPIKLSTIPASKGLSGDIVFMTHVDDQYYIRKKVPGQPAISDQEICNFIVALTRTKKLACVISTQAAKPTFMSWIDKSRIT